MKFDTSPSLERWALGLGLASSLCLGVAAFAAFGDSRDVGWSRVDDLSTRARNNVREAWEALLRVDSSAAQPLQPASALIVLDGPLLAPPPQALRPQPIEPPNLFSVLFAESEHQALAAADLPQALAIMTEAVDKQAPPEHLAQARLRAIQLAQQLGRAEEARAHWELARAQIDPALVSQDTSTLLFCALAALPAFSAAQRAAAVEDVVGLWTANALVLPDAGRGFARTGEDGRGPFEWSPALRESALRARLAELVEFPPHWNASFAEFDERAARTDFLERFGDVAANGLARESWSLLPAADELLAVRLDEQGRRVGRIVERAAAEAALIAELAARHGLPEGFTLDLRGENATQGEMVGPWIDLGAALPRVALRHPDIASVLREAAARTRWLRIGMLILALFVAGAALATFLALRRERRLAQARSTFIANVSHELRTPLASILLMSENLESGRAGLHAALYPKLLRRESLRLRRLIDDVLDFSRLERGKRFQTRIEDVDVAAWYEALCSDALATAAQANVELACTGDALPARAAFDGEALRRAVLNLIDNALRHSGSKRVDLGARMRGSGDLVLTVSDRGCGIPPSQRSTVFEAFVRLNGSTAAGAGLGLAIVREIAVAHGGSVIVRDPPDHPGALFELSIPLREMASMAHEETA